MVTNASLKCTIFCKDFRYFHHWWRWRLSSLRNTHFSGGQPHPADLRQRAYQITGSLLVWENGGSNAATSLDCAAALERVYHDQATRLQMIWPTHPVATNYQ